MRVIGIVSELRHKPGIYGYEKVWRRTGLSWDSPQVATGLSAAIGLTTISQVILGALKLTPYGILLSAPLAAAGMLPLFKSKERLAFLHDTPDDDPSNAQRAYAGGLVLPGALLKHHTIQLDDPVLYGLFQSNRELRRVLNSEGGNVDIWIVPTTAANRVFEHLGGPSGQFSTGLYLPEPKDPRVLVPLRGYPTTLRDHVLQEWVRAFEALGAKKVVICDTTDGKLSGAATVPTEAGTVTAELKAQYGRSLVRESTYGPGTFDPDRATAGRRWIADFSAIQSIVEGRIHGSQLGYREKLTLDTSFGIDTKLLSTWSAGLGGSFKRTYEIAVDFYPRQ